MNKVKFTVYGTPVAKGRPRIGKWGAYTPEKTVNYENLVKLSYIQECGNTKLDGCLKAEIVAYFPIPKSTSKKKRLLMENGEIRHDKKPDLDNIIKSVLDSLNEVAYADDNAVVEIHAEKRYSENPRAEVKLTVIESEDI